MKINLKVFVLVILFFVSGAGWGQQAAPANVAAALTLKILKYERNIADAGEISIFVIGAPDIQAELAKGIGKQIGNSTLKTVETGGEIPASPPTVLFVGDPAQLQAATQFSQDHDVLTVTQHPGLVSKGVTLGIGVGEDGKPKILINLSSSAEENLDWNSAIMKIATTID